MPGARDRINGVKAFFNDVFAEGRKCAWPGRQELVESTIVVVISMLLLGTFVYCSDQILALVLRVLTGRA